MTIYYEKKLSQKTQRPYNVIAVDLGWRVSPICFDAQTICDILHMSNEELYNLPLGKKIVLGELNVE